MKTIKIKQGLSIYDYAGQLNGGFDNIISTVLLNPEFESIDVDLNSFAGQDLNYDETYKSPVIQIGLSTVAGSSTKNYTGIDGQNLYDISGLTYCGFDNIIKLIIESGVDSINSISAKGVLFNFDSNLIQNGSLFNLINKKRFIFGTLVQNAPRGRFRIINDGSIRGINTGNYRIVNG